ncbi:GNAT family N-acetyltransferase [Nocardia sp. NPDC127526]|uniref:GNAT family N-acetyltransferase n=1 Tax=Nocardia sp. NPDC127526 TaxID=3345393 RepID=UPI00363A0548
MASITLRSATADDRPRIRELLATCFGSRSDPSEHEHAAELFPIERAILAVDGDQIVGHTVDRTMTVTVPGSNTVQACGVSAVGVAPTHRRRGILRQLYTELHRRAEADNLPLTMFTASEGTIYGRFGYGPSTIRHEISIDRRRAEFRPGTPDPGGVRIESLDNAKDHLREVYDRWRRLVPGAQVRPEANWQLWFADPERYRNGASGLFVLTHPDGYVLYRRKWGDNDENTASVTEFCAVTPDAHIALWRVLLSLDLCTKIEGSLTENDPLPYLVTDPRLVKVTDRYDGMWTRVMDVPAALTTRGYRADLDVVVSVVDPFREAGGAFALRVRDGVAECERTDAAPDLELGIDVLGSLYFGAHRARVFAAANRIQAKDATVLRAFDEAFATDRDAELGWFF